MTRVVDIAFVKGHGTENDFVILPDPDAQIDLTAERTRWLCDRRAGIGGDGVLRVVRCAAVPEFAQFADVAEYFMDYRNADGSLAEMCGNGARVFVRYLHATGALTSRTTVIATRMGLVTAEVRGAEAEEIAIGMGSVSDVSIPLPITVRPTDTDHTWDAVAVHVPNPHAVVVVEDLEQAGSLDQAPAVRPQEVFPDGVNVEFVKVLSPDHIAMRVHERGVGETRSCGTGACAAAWVAATSLTSTSDTFQVDVPGGTVWVDIASDGQLTLRGPAELVSRGRFQWPRGL